jgi:hypothetical protein
VVFLTQLHDPECNPAPLYLPPWILNYPMEPSGNIHVTAQPRLRSALPPEPLPDPAANIIPMARVPTNSMGRVQREGEERASISFAEWAPWNRDSGKRVWSYSYNGVMDAETLANACRVMFVAMRTHSARAARLTREREMLLRSRDEARFTLELRAARLRTLAQGLGREADNIYIVEPRAESERPLKRSHYDE